MPRDELAAATTAAVSFTIRNSLTLGCPFLDTVLGTGTTTATTTTTTTIKGRLEQLNEEK
jgi:hypothetical protein